MTVPASVNKYRIQLKKARQSPESLGGFSRDYETLLSVWAEVKSLSHGVYIRGVQAGTTATHEINIRRAALLDALRGAFSKAFSTGFEGSDAYPMKSEFFIFVPRESDTKGILVRVRRIIEVGVRRENLSMLCEEMEQQGTGWDNG